MGRDRSRAVDGRSPLPRARRGTDAGRGERRVRHGDQPVPAGRARAGAGVEHHYADLPDRPLLPDQLGEVCRLADLAVVAVRAGRRVLVRCHFGYNRSGLVVAHGLVTMGHPVEDAIALVRSRRSEWALHNRVFVDYLTTGLDVARLLSGLDA
ncbi:hypothetical protein ACFQHO_21885 [Actinomadura yumaensis]|uniref:protein-tyrosine phosphatase family protein n=1 Tax=Actinomadura yumaensis TaxID=111807 RepID=UPI00361A7378